MNKYIFLYLLTVLCSFTPGFAQVPGKFVFYRGDTLQGMAIDKMYQESVEYSVLHHLSESELRNSLFRKEEEFVNKKYHIQKHAKAILDPNQHIMRTSSCNNVDFENGDFSGWAGFIGYNQTSGSPLTVTSVGVSTLGINSSESTCSYHTLVTAAAGNDLLGGFSELDPGGGTYAVRLGGYSVNVNSNYSCNGGGAGGESAGELLQQTFRVSAANSLFTYKYAVVLNDGGHNQGEQPYFKIEVLDSTGAPVPCLQFYVEAIAGVLPPGFLPSAYVNGSDYSPCYYLPWASNSLNLSAYISKTITVRFTAAGCIYGEHFGYGYVDCSCSPVQINTSVPSACQGSSITLPAPPGADSYNWVEIPAGPGIVGTTTSQSCAVNQSGKYQVTVQTGACSYTVDTTVFIYSPPLLTMTSTPVSCNGSNDGKTSVNVTPGDPPPYTYSWNTVPVQTGSTADGLGPGTYSVTVSGSAGCTSSASVTVIQPQPLSSTYTQSNLTCRGSGNGSARIVPAGGNPPYVFSWSPGGGTSDTITGRSSGTYTCTIYDSKNCMFIQTVQLSEPPALNMVLQTRAVSCHGGNNGIAIASASGGTGSYRFSWAPGGALTDTATGLNAGSYLCTIHDANNCLDTQSVSVSQPTLISETISAHAVSCNGGSNGTAVASATGGTQPYTYLWSPGGMTSDTAKGLQAITYLCTITDSHGCLDTQSVNMSQASVFNVGLFSKPVSCHGGNDGIAAVTVTGGTSPYNFSWSGATGNSDTLKGLSAQTALCTITDTHNCTTTASVTVSQPPPLAATGASTPVSCFNGHNGTAVVSVSGGIPGTYQYSWSSGGTTNMAAGLSEGQDTCWYKDGNGCHSMCVVSVTQPPQLSATNTVISATCGLPNGSVSVNGSGGKGAYSYSWTPAPGNSASLTNLAAGNYTCTLNDSNQCTILIPVTVPNTGVPPVAVLTTSVPATFCKGIINTLNASGGTGYSWSTGATTASIIATLAGTYEVHVSNNCGIDSASVTLVVLPLPNPAITGGASICSGESELLTATGGLSYSWSTGSTGPSISVTQAGTYTVTATNGCGSVSSTFALTLNSVNALFGATPQTGSAPLQVSFADESSVKGINWVWNLGDENTETGIATLQHIYTTPGIYTVLMTVTDSLGCTGTYSTTIDVVYPPSWIVVPNVFTPNNDGDNDLFLIRSYSLSSLNVKIYDRWGVYLAELNGIEEGWDGRTAAGEMAVNGTYYYMLKAQGKEGKLYDQQGFFMLIH
jgi:gliding motility-associated-like protein